MSDQRFKLIHNRAPQRHNSDNGATPYAKWELYDLIDARAETTDIAPMLADVTERMRLGRAEWETSCKQSSAGHDCPQQRKVGHEVVSMTFTFEG